MDNYKVKVENEAESKEVQELLFELGYKKNAKFTKEDFIDFGGWICALDDGSCDYCPTSPTDKELTLQELKDLVVLKRNDVGDATHINFRTNTPFLSQGSKEYFYLNNKWILSDSVNDLKPIEKKEMKEFLVNHDNKWTLQLLDSDTEENSYRVAVPSGANICIDRYYFYVDYNTALTDQGWMDCEKAGLKTVESMVKTGGRIIWQRSETEYLMQGENGDKLMESIAQLKNQDTVKVTIDELKHRVYKKDVSHLKIVDVYRVLELFDVKSHAVGHAIKKLLLSGDRGAKDEAQDIQEAIDSLIRYQEMKNEDSEVRFWSLWL